MLQALLHGKLSREQENMEDLLTSAVFGRLRYVPPEDGLFPLLEESKGPDDSKPLEHLRSKYAGATVEYVFWPWWENHGCTTCEPDLLLRIDLSGGRRVMIAIEAKFKSGKSAVAEEGATSPTDQLAKEWDHLVHISKSLGVAPDDRWLIYLTASTIVPEKEIQDSCDEYAKFWPNEPHPRILALSWRQVVEVFTSQCKTDHPNSHSSMVLSDLIGLMTRLELLYYRGLGELKPVKHWNWEFTAWSPASMRLQPHPKILWRFANGE